MSGAEDALDRMSRAFDFNPMGTDEPMKKGEYDFGAFDIAGMGIGGGARFLSKPILASKSKTMKMIRKARKKNPNDPLVTKFDDIQRTQLDGKATTDKMRELSDDLDAVDEGIRRNTDPASLQDLQARRDLIKERIDEAAALAGQLDARAGAMYDDVKNLVMRRKGEKAVYGEGVRNIILSELAIDGGANVGATNLAHNADAGPMGILAAGLVGGIAAGAAGTAAYRSAFPGSRTGGLRASAIDSAGLDDIARAMEPDNVMPGSMDPRMLDLGVYVGADETVLTRTKPTAYDGLDQRVQTLAPYANRMADKRGVTPGRQRLLSVLPVQHAQPYVNYSIAEEYLAEFTSMFDPKTGELSPARVEQLMDALARRPEVRTDLILQAARTKIEHQVGHVHGRNPRTDTTQPPLKGSDFSPVLSDGEKAWLGDIQTAVRRHNAANPWSDFDPKVAQMLRDTDMETVNADMDGAMQRLGQANGLTGPEMDVVHNTDFHAIQQKYENAHSMEITPETMRTEIRKSLKGQPLPVIQYAQNWWDQQRKREFYMTNNDEAAADLYRAAQEIDTRLASVSPGAPPSGASPLVAGSSGATLVMSELAPYQRLADTQSIHTRSIIHIDAIDTDRRAKWKGDEWLDDVPHVVGVVADPRTGELVPVRNANAIDMARANGENSVSIVRLDGQVTSKSNRKRTIYAMGGSQVADEIMAKTEGTAITGAELPRHTYMVTTDKDLQPAPKADRDVQPESKYKKAGGEVDGRTVRDGVPNTGSISSSLNEYKELPGIREVPMSEFSLTGRHYSVAGTKRIKDLAEEIRQSGEISPLIVVMEKGGPYILEGATRAEALHNLGAKSFPAMVVFDLESPPMPTGSKTPRSALPKGVKQTNTALPTWKVEVGEKKFTIVRESKKLPGHVVRDGDGNVIATVNTNRQAYEAISAATGGPKPPKNTSVIYGRLPASGGGPAFVSSFKSKAQARLGQLALKGAITVAKRTVKGDYDQGYKALDGIMKVHKDMGIIPPGVSRKDLKKSMGDWEGRHPSDLYRRYFKELEQVSEIIDPGITYLPGELASMNTRDVKMVELDSRSIPDGALAEHDIMSSAYTNEVRAYTDMHGRLMDSAEADDVDFDLGDSGQPVSLTGQPKPSDMDPPTADYETATPVEFYSAYADIGPTVDGDEYAAIGTIGGGDPNVRAHTRIFDPSSPEYAAVSDGIIETMPGAVPPSEGLLPAERAMVAGFSAANVMRRSGFADELLTGRLMEEIPGGRSDDFIKDFQKKVTQWRGKADKVRVKLTPSRSKHGLAPETRQIIHEAHGKKKRSTAAHEAKGILGVAARLAAMDEGATMFGANQANLRRRLEKEAREGIGRDAKTQALETAAFKEADHYGENLAKNGGDMMVEAWYDNFDRVNLFNEDKLADLIDVPGMPGSALVVRDFMRITNESLRHLMGVMNELDPGVAALMRNNYTPTHRYDMEKSAANFMKMAANGTLDIHIPNRDRQRAIEKQLGLNFASQTGLSSVTNVPEGRLNAAESELMRRSGPNFLKARQSVGRNDTPGVTPVQGPNSGEWFSYAELRNEGWVPTTRNPFRLGQMKIDDVTNAIEKAQVVKYLKDANIAVKMTVKELEEYNSRSASALAMGAQHPEMVAAKGVILGENSLMPHKKAPKKQAPQWYIPADAAEMINNFYLSKDVRASQERVMGVGPRKGPLMRGTRKVSVAGTSAELLLPLFHGALIGNDSGGQGFIEAVQGLQNAGSVTRARMKNKGTSLPARALNAFGEGGHPMGQNLLDGGHGIADAVATTTRGLVKLAPLAGSFAAINVGDWAFVLPAVSVGMFMGATKPGAIVAQYANMFTNTMVDKVEGLTGAKSGSLGRDHVRRTPHRPWHPDEGERGRHDPQHPPRGGRLPSHRHGGCPNP